LAGEFINLYPPGTPILVPGERFAKETITFLEECLAKNLQVQGISKDSNVRVLV
jgi:arginine/lysine/ornithine decarboxylase